MRINSPCCSPKSVLKVIGFVFLAVICGSVSATWAANPKPPVLLSDTNSTRAIALESVTFKAEPFPSPRP